MPYQCCCLHVRAADRPAACLLWDISRLVLEGCWKFRLLLGLAHDLLSSFLFLLHSLPCRTPTFHPRFRQMVGHGLIRHLYPEHAPGTRNDTIGIIASTT